jgi:hypothetical protein
MIATSIGFLRSDRHTLNHVKDESLVVSTRRFARSCFTYAYQIMTKYNTLPTKNNLIAQELEKVKIASLSHDIALVASNRQTVTYHCLPSLKTVMHQIVSAIFLKIPRVKHRFVHSTYTNVLAPDIWHIVASFLIPSTLAKLCLASSYFLEIFRPILYRRLILRFNSEHVKSTLKLLCSNETLAHHVTSFAILIFKPHPPRRTRSSRRWKFIREVFPSAQERLIEAISRMTSLQTISMHNSVFANLTDERTFIQRLKECKIPIRNFTYIGGSHFRIAELSRNDLALTKLTTLTWDLREINAKDHSKSEH